MEDECRSHTHRLRRQEKTAIHPTTDKSVHPSTANLFPPLLPGSFCPVPSCNAPLLIITCLQHCARSRRRSLPAGSKAALHSPTATRVPRGQGGPPCTAAQLQPAQRQAARAGGSQLHEHLTSSLPARGQLSQSQGWGKMQCCPCQVCPFNKFTEKNQQFPHP